MKVNFIPLDFDYIDKDDSCLIRIWGKTSEGKRICIFDSTPAYFWLIPKAGVNLEHYAKKVLGIKQAHAGRTARVLDVKTKDKNFLGKKVKALQVFINNPKDAGVIKDIVKEFKETDKKKEKEIDFDWKKIFEFFKKPSVTKKYSIKFDSMNEEALKEILVSKHEFGENRIKAAIDKVKAQKEAGKQKDL
ncbi:unnamed protein product, partial [marine sediment metagenome]